MYVDYGSGWVAVALHSWGKWLGHCGTFVNGSSGSGTFVYGGSDMCVGGTNYKSVGNDSGLLVVASVLL